MNMLVSDFDKTFFTTDYIKNIKIVNNFVDNSNIFVIATGRNISHLLTDIINVNLKYKYLICNDGGVIYNKDLKEIFRKDISKKSLNIIINIIKKYYNKGINDWFIDTSKIYTKNINNDANAVIISINDNTIGNKILLEIKSFCDDIEGYCTDNWLNIRAIGTSKKEGINFISKIEKINKKNIYTIGDNINDIDMIKEYNGYCVENSNEELKTICKNCVKDIKGLIEKIKNRS